jgi:hypothetical protein
MKKLVVAFAVLGMFGGAPAVNGEGFGNGTLEGTFAFSAHGVVGTNIAIPFSPSIIVADTPVVTVGVITFNEDGTCVSAATTKAGDVSVIPPHPSSACTFSVNPDGTGKISVTKTGSPFSPVELAFAIVNADELLLITTDELVLSGVAKRQ